MNSITRIILRGLVSGEIKPEPQVFEYLKELNERSPRRHPRILRPLRPAGQAGIQINQEPPQTSPTNSEPADEDQSNERESADAGPLHRSWSTFANVSPGRWVRLTLCALVAVAAMGHVELAAHAAGHPVDPNLIQSVASGSAFNALQVLNVVGMSAGIAGLSHPFPQVLLWAGGILLAMLGIRAGGSYVCRRWLYVLRPYERALQELEAVRFRAGKGKIAAPCHAVLGVMRNYLEAQFGLQTDGSEPEAIQRTVRRSKSSMKEWQRAMLDRLLESACHENASELSESNDLNEQATRFVWATACCRPGKPGRV